MRLPNLAGIMELIRGRKRPLDAGTAHGTVEGMPDLDPQLLAELGITLPGLDPGMVQGQVIQGDPNQMPGAATGEVKAGPYDDQINRYSKMVEDAIATLNSPAPKITQVQQNPFEQLAELFAVHEGGPSNVGAAARLATDRAAMTDAQNMRDYEARIGGAKASAQYGSSALNYYLDRDAAAQAVDARVKAAELKGQATQAAQAVKADKEARFKIAEQVASGKATPTSIAQLLLGSGMQYELAQATAEQLWADIGRDPLNWYRQYQMDSLEVRQDQARKAEIEDLWKRANDKVNGTEGSQREALMRLAEIDPQFQQRLATGATIDQYLAQKTPAQQLKEAQTARIEELNKITQKEVQVFDQKFQLYTRATESAILQRANMTNIAQYNAATARKNSDQQLVIAAMKESGDLLISANIALQKANEAITAYQSIGEAPPPEMLEQREAIIRTINGVDSNGVPLTDNEGRPMMSLKAKAAKWESIVNDLMNRNVAAAGPEVRTVTPTGQQVNGLEAYDTGAGVRAVRNNNPLNIKASNTTKAYDGVMGVESKAAADGGHFLVFETAEQGFAAAARLLRSGGYQGRTVDAALRRWSNNGYGGDVAKTVGIDGSRKMSSLSDDELEQLVLAMAKREGFPVQTTEPQSSKPSGKPGATGATSAIGASMKAVESAAATAPKPGASTPTIRGATTGGTMKKKG